MEFETFALSNGIRVVHRRNDRPVAHCSLMINAGSRDEKSDEEGLAHFIEHVLFKGTRRRKAYHILSRMEDAGGELNAYTDKETTVIYSSFLKGHYARAVDLIFDILLNSTFPVKELEREKEVILDEINSYKDSPSELIFDDFEGLLFPKHPLGSNILGIPEKVRAFSQKDVLRFIEREYGTNRMVFASVGDISSKRLRNLLEKHLSDHRLSERSISRQSPGVYKTGKEQHKRSNYQSHILIGNRAYQADHKKSRVLLLLNNILGGPGMNSRLNLNIRERHGYTYHLESYYTPYSDTGVFGIYAGTDPSNLERTHQLITRELSSLKKKALGTMQLSKAKRQFMGQIAMAQENNTALMLALGKSLLSFDRIDSFEEIQKKIEGISASELMEVAEEIFDEAKLSVLIYEPVS
jgi:predicted Zn-dependent peptidase